MNAPSARNVKPYEFIIIKDKDKLEKLSIVKKNAYMVKDSNITIVVLGKDETEFWQLDLGATHYDIASCWIGINKEQGNYLRQQLNVPNELNIVSMVSLGYRNEAKDRNNNYYENKIHFEIY